MYFKRSLCARFPRKHDTMLQFLGKALRDEVSCKVSKHLLFHFMESKCGIEIRLAVLLHGRTDRQDLTISRHAWAYVVCTGWRGVQASNCGDNHLCCARKLRCQGNWSVNLKTAYWFLLFCCTKTLTMLAAHLCVVCTHGCLLCFVLPSCTLVFWSPLRTALSHLCEYIEDCEHTDLAIRILHLLGEEGARSSRPNVYVRFIYNRIILENASIRAGMFGVGTVPLGTIVVQIMCVCCMYITNYSCANPCMVVGACFVFHSKWLPILEGLQKLLRLVLVCEILFRLVRPCLSG